jgi:hypothetical protein
MKKLLLVTTVTAGLNLALISSAGAQTYGGSATGASVTVPATGTTIRAASGALSISGGGAEASLLVDDIPGSATGGVVELRAGTMHAGIVGLDATRGEASMGNMSLTVSGNQLSADFLMARAAASCGPAGTGNSQLDNLVINGQAIAVTGAANQTVTLPNGTAVINRQTVTVGGTSAQLVVDALHVRTVDPVTGQELADVALGQRMRESTAKADRRPTPASVPAADGFQVCREAARTSEWSAGLMTEQRRRTSSSTITVQQTSACTARPKSSKTPSPAQQRSRVRRTATSAPCNSPSGLKIMASRA